jgi:hypothetical protein
MSKPDPITYWDARKEADRQAFMTLLAPLVIASHARWFDDPASAGPVLTTWMQALADVPRELVAAGCLRLLPSVTWPPRPGDLRQACADVRAEARQIATRKAVALRADCAQCGGSQWVSITDDRGVERMKRCWCFTRGLELIAEAGAPIARPTLPAYEPEPAA